MVPSRWPWAEAAGLVERSPGGLVGGPGLKPQGWPSEALAGWSVAPAGWSVAPAGWSVALAGWSVAPAGWSVALAGLGPFRRMRRMWPAVARLLNA